MDRRPNSNLSAGRIALGYSVIAILWIAFSDAAVTHLKLHPLVMTLKGTIFVFVTASLLYLTIRRLVQAVRQTSRERDETAELYRTVVEASNEGMCLLDESGRISFLNERLAAMLGRPAEELQGTRLQDFLEEPQVLAQPGARHSETRECRLRKCSEAKPWVLISRRPVVNDAGEVVGLVVTVADSTEPKWTDKALRRGEAYLAAFSGFQENVGERRLARPVQYGLAILSVGVAVGTGLLLQYFHFHVPGALLLFAVAVSSWYGRLGSAVLAAVLATGSYYYCFVEPVHTIYINRSEIPFFIIFVSLAALLAWFGVVRRRIEANLRAQADLLNLTHDAIFVTDLEGLIKYWNRGAEERYGWTAEQAVGRVAHDLLRTVFPRPLEHVKAELTGTGFWEGEISHTRKDGTQVVVASRWSLQRNNRGTPVAILETNNDITARKRSEEALHRLNRELRAISNCNQTLLRATDEQSLLQEVCRIVCEDAGYRPVWVGYVEHDQAKSVRPVAWAGADEAYLENAKISWSEDTELGRGPTGTAIRSGQTCYVQDFATDPRVAPWRELLLRGGFRSAISLPLKDEHAKVFGALSMHSERPNAFTPEEIRLLEELAGDLAFGIVTLRSRAARKQAEEAVRRHEQELRQILDISPQLVAEFGPNRQRLYANRPTLDYLGVTLDGWRSLSDPFYFYHPDDRERITREAYTGDLSHEFEARFRRHDGTYRWFLFRDGALRDEQGRATRWYLAATDIEDRKQAEEALRQSEANLSRAQQVAHIGSWHLDIVRNRLTWSDEVFRIFGVPSVAALTYEAFLDRVYPGDRESVHNAWSAALNGAPYDIEHRIIVGDDVKWVREQAELEFSKEGTATGGIGTVQDITDRKRVEEEVRNTAAQWQATFDAVQDSIVLLDKNFRILRANHAAAKFLGLPLEKILGGQCYDFTHGVSTPPAECPLAKLRQSGSHQEAEVLARKGGPWLSVSVDPLFDASGELAQVVHVARDITERKRAEEALRRSEAYLKDAQRLSHTGSWAFDVAINRYVYLSEECSAIFELDAQDGSPEREAVSRLIHREDWDRVNADYEKSVREKVDTLSEFRITLPSGTTKYIQAIRHPVTNDTGELVELVGTVIDITERKLAEEARRRGEAYLKEAQRLSHTGSWAFDVASGKYIYWSEELFGIFGFDPQQGIGSLEEVIRRFHPEDVNRFKENFEKSLREKVDTSCECRFVMPDGTVKHLHLIRRPVLNDAGEVVQLVGTTMDITERKRAEETLRRTTAYLAEAQRLTHTGAWATDAKPEPLYWSEELFRLYGFEPQDTPPTHDQAIQRVHPEDREKYVRAWQRVIRQKVDSEVEFRTVLPDGAIRYLYGLGHPVLNSRGELVEMVGTTVDITERKRAEEALRRSEAYLTEAQRLTHTGSWAYDPAGRPIYWSEEMFRIYDFDPTQDSPTRAQRETRVHPEDLQSIRQARHKMLHEKLDCDFEHRIVLSDGRVRHVHVLGHPVLGPAGEVLGTVGTTVDITERKRAEEALRESETRFRTFVDHTTDAFFMLDLEQGTIVDVNRPACESIGYTREELIGTKPTAFHLDSEQAHMQSVAERAAAGEPVSDRHWHRRKDGSVFPVDVQTSAVSHGGRRFLLKVARDITHQVQAEEQREKLRQIEADLAHIHRVSMMGELTASIAHEVNQPLSGVVSNASACLRWLARDVPDLGEAREALNRIVRDGKRAGEVIKRIRAMTKRSIVAPEQLNLNETIREILVLVSDEAKRSQVTIRTLFADDLSPVSADRVQMQQVLLNLIMNGIEAMSAVDDRLRELVLITRNSGADRVQVTVEDSGTGLAPEAMEKIFDPFYTTKSGGMGMGLSICRSIVQHHGGRLWATIRDGPGTSFHFTLSKCQNEE